MRQCSNRKKLCFVKYTFKKKKKKKERKKKEKKRKEKKKENIELTLSRAQNSQEQTE